jgi:hypothetical protein
VKKSVIHPAPSSTMSSATFVAALALALALSSTTASASQTRVETVQGATDLLSGELEGASVGGDGVVTAGPEQRVVVDGLVGAVLAVARGGDGGLYVATGTPGRVLRGDGGKADVVWDADKPLVTALVPLGQDRIVAITAPDGGAEVIELSTRKRTSIPAKGTSMLLSAAAVDGDVYAVGGGDDGGVVLRLAAGASDWTLVATTKHLLRSVAAGRQAGEVRVVCGSADEGVVYDVLVGSGGARVRALLDATPGEVTSVALTDDGIVFAGFTDGEGRLSKAAGAKAREEGGGDDDDKKPAKKSRARKVKGGEIWRIARGGSARVVFQSREHGPYALAVDAGGKRVLAGTGPEGRLLALDLQGPPQARPMVWTRRAGHDEITALLVEKGVVVAGASHGGAVLALGGGTYAKAAYVSPPLEAGGLARWGLVRATFARVASSPARLALRTGHTREPDETWSDWSAARSASADGVVLDAPPAPFAQVRVELPAGTALSALHAAQLVENRAPEVVSVDVLAPGWKVVPSPREPPETRSVTFAEKPFARFLDRRGAQNPTLDERPYGKQSFDLGFRTVYAYVEDADKDALRYRFWLGVSLAGAAGQADVATWTLLQDWSEAPFVSFEASRLADGEYRVKIDVDDRPTNGPARALSETVVSDRFVVSHVAPRVVEPGAARVKGGVRLTMRVDAALPLVAARCSTQLSEWQPLDPKDGLLDGRSESFDVVVDAGEGTSSVSCELYDEALNFARVDVPVR